MARDPTPEQWASTVLQRLGYNPTPGALQALVGWSKAEGGHWNNDARYNPLNTTQNMPGAGNTGTQGNIKVYKSWDQGIDATVKTLENGYYGGILKGLQAGDPNAVASAIDKSPWGTHGDLVYRTIAGTKAPKVGPSSMPKAPTAAPAPQSYGQPAAASPGVNNAPLRRQLIGQFLQQGGVANSNAVLTLAGSYGQAADVPASAAPAAASYAQPQPQAQTPTLKKSATGLVPLGGSKNAGKGSFEISGPNPGRLKKNLVSFADQVAAVIGAPIVGLDGSSHSKYTVNGNVSQHYTGDATDIFTIGGKPATGARLLRAGRAALIAAGMPRAQALKAQGGLYNVNGHQIIFSAKGDAVGGDHTDHLHISD